MTLLDACQTDSAAEWSGRFSILLAAFLLLLLPAAFGGPISTCQNLSTANTIYNLTQNVSSTGTCFNVTAQNITLDCQSYTISGTNSSLTSAIYANQTNITVRNCNISNFDYGIYYSNVDNGLIANNTLRTPYTSRGWSISLHDDSDGNLIANNTATGRIGYVTYFGTASDNNNFTNNSAYAQFSANPNGYYIDTGANNSIDCQGKSVTGINASDTSGIYSNVVNTTLKNCNISNFSQGIGIGSQAVGTIATNNTIVVTVTEGFGIKVYVGANNSLSYLNNITAPVWVNDSGTNSQFNSSSIGNIYYFTNGTRADSVFAIYDTDGDNWADAGSARPFNATTVGGNWSGNGSDWHPYSTQNRNCANLATADQTYTLGYNLSSAGTCFNITAAGVTLDCAGYTITGTNAADTYGVYSNRNQTTIRNCNIINFSSEIYLDASNHSVVNNNTLNNSLHSASSYGFAAYGAIGNLTLTANTISKSNLGYGIYLEFDTNNTTIDCQGAPMTGDATVFTYGIYAAGNRTTIKNCPLTSFSEGIRFAGGYDLTVRNNTIRGRLNGAEQIVFDAGYTSGVHNVLVENNTFTLSSEPAMATTLGVDFYDGSTESNVTVRNNTFLKSGTEAVIAIKISNAAANASILRNNITADVWVDNAGGATLVSFNDSSVGNIYYFSNGTASWDVYNVTDTNSDGWADAGTGRPFNSTSVGSRWSGAGGDWHPFTLNAQPVPVIVQNVSFTNSSAGASFLASATASHATGGGNITSWNISTTSGTCVNYSNSTSGSNRTVTFNCSGTALQSATVNITFTDYTNLSASTSGTNTYPNNGDSPASTPATSSGYSATGGGSFPPRPPVPPVTPPVTPPVEPPVEPPITPPVAPPVTPPVEPPAEPPGQPTAIPGTQPRAGEPPSLAPSAGEGSAGPLAGLLKSFGPLLPLVAALIFILIIAAILALLLRRRKKNAPPSNPKDKKK